MPFSTIGQGWIFLGCLLTGLVMGLAYEAGFILRFCFTKLFKESKPSSTPQNAETPGKPESSKSKPNKPEKYFNRENLPSLIISFAADIIFFAICFFLILLSAQITADGQVFWFSVAAYIIGFILERISLGIIVAKFINLIYNTLAKALERLKKSKLFGKLFR